MDVSHNKKRCNRNIIDYSKLKSVTKLQLVFVNQRMALVFVLAGARFITIRFDRSSESEFLRLVCTRFRISLIAVSGGLTISHCDIPGDIST